MFAGNGETFTTWMFAECGMEEPLMEMVREKCPVVLNEEDSNQELLMKIEQLARCQVDNE